MVAKQNNIFRLKIYWISGKYELHLIRKMIMIDKPLGLAPRFACQPIAGLTSY